jgi:hypothetical protein
VLVNATIGCRSDTQQHAVDAPALDQDTLDLLDQSNEVDMRTPRRDGSVSSRPIWVVVVAGNAYVRSFRGTRGAWYRRALADGRAVIGVGRFILELVVEPVTDDELNRRVSDAFRAKYGARSPGPTEAMVSPDITQTTMRLTRPVSRG